MKTKPDATDLADIQGLVYSGWGEHPFAAYLFATLHDRELSRAWLAQLLPHVSPASTGKTAPGDRLNIALSPAGLAKLGVPESVLAALPQEAKNGMASRARILGDDKPTDWELGTDNELDVLVMIFARDENRRAELVAEHTERLRAAGANVREPELSHPLGGKEHFGFADGVSQPFLAGRYDAPRHHDAAIATGEILLGYPNAYDKLPASPRWSDDDDFGKNGTYLVFRKLHQHVADFWGYLARQAGQLAPDPSAAVALTELLGAKLVGRWKSGASLVLAPDRDDPRYATPERINAFRYLDKDPHGERCPISSHVRRANPRDARGGDAKASLKVSSRHRILRRGRSYGHPLADADALAGRDDGVARGLYFISLQASIARGFEFIQQTWLSNPGFNGLFSEPDPVMGNGDGTAEVSIPDSPLRLRLQDVPSVVTVKGGGYFFLPALAALRRVAGA
ncbi:MAG TPA: Dyp-type peroxidase [Kofleriaceae bacterium]|nr:Dyp-type peroxidase [Kofleriaceae bacterium]